MNKKNINITRGCEFSAENAEQGVKVVKGCWKLNSVDWIEPLNPNKVDKVYEVRFKNTRKGYYENVNSLALKVGDIVAVEGNPGHDIGIVSMTGDMVAKQMRCRGFHAADIEFKKIYRVAKPYDIERWQEAIALEYPTMIKARQIAERLNLNMKIGDVEYQGDRIKAIFYYIADVRVDFRELIKILADEFKVRIEMKQIGARQEAGRIGGIASCGRELCCSTFVTNFVSVTTNSARFQDILLNPQKLAGQCGKLKCCLNYEVDSYIDARKGFPKVNEPLRAKDQNYFLVKTDIFKREMTFSTDPNLFVNTKVLSVDTVKELLALNRKGIMIDEIVSESVEKSVEETPDYKNVVGDDSITRFDKTNRKPRGGRDRRGRGERGERRERPESEAKEPRQKEAAVGAGESQGESRNGANQRRDNRKQSGTEQRPRREADRRENEGGAERREGEPRRENEQRREVSRESEQRRENESRKEGEPRREGEARRDGNRNNNRNNHNRNRNQNRKKPENKPE